MPDTDAISTIVTANSIYEVDRGRQLVRKTSDNLGGGLHGLDSADWKPYEDFHVTFGRAFFTWADGSSTITSPVLT